MASILVADDEEDVQKLVRCYLEYEGHKVQGVSNGVQLLEALGVEPSNISLALPDLVIMDVAMPGLDGHTLAARLHREARTASLPILMLTAKGGMGSFFQNLTNVKGFMSKPFDADELVNLVAEVLKKP